MNYKKAYKMLKEYCLGELDTVYCYNYGKEFDDTNIAKAVLGWINRTELND